MVFISARCPSDRKHCYYFPILSALTTMCLRTQRPKISLPKFSTSMSLILNNRFSSMPSSCQNEFTLFLVNQDLYQSTRCLSIFSPRLKWWAKIFPVQLVELESQYLRRATKHLSRSFKFWSAYSHWYNPLSYHCLSPCHQAPLSRQLSRSLPSCLTT